MSDERVAVVAALLQGFFGPSYGFGDAYGYMRHAGQLYRIERLGGKRFALFRVKDVGKTGKPTEPPVFSSVAKARDYARRQPAAKGGQR